jgi:hypothetical protein
MEPAATSVRSRRGRMKENAPTAKRLASGSKDMKNPNAITRKRMKQRQRFKPSRRNVSAQASGKNIRKIHTIWYVIIPCPKMV